ncbi:MAG: L-threonylcarbamoyladenylate synthase [Marinoscillum sp.]|jgi:L-threonylcarbamoyladenylate synthase
MAQIGQDITLAKKLLEQGDLVAIPTETVYGLAGNALNEKALLEIFKVKRRPKFDPLIVHTDSIEKIKKLVTHIPDQLQQLADAFWPGPLTLLLEKQLFVPDLLTSGLPHVAVRIPRHAVTLDLLASLDFPLAAPSANPFGYISPTTAQHVADQLGTLIPYILDGGDCHVGLESTIIGFDELNRPVVYRLGGKKMEDIEAVIGPVRLRLNESSDPSAPGMLKSHYAPKKCLYIGKVEDLLLHHQGKKIGVISFMATRPSLSIDRQLVLSSTGDMDEAASKLFGSLRLMDQSDVDIIIAEWFPEDGLGAAINDRLKRASTR